MESWEQTLTALAGASRLAAGSLARRFRRRRTRIPWAAAAGLTAVAALAVGVPVALSSGPGGRASHPAPPPPKVTFTVTVNGRTRPDPVSNVTGHQPQFSVTPAEQLRISVSVHVPAHVTLTTVWLGISAGSWGGSPGRPAGMDPALLHTRARLGPGPHRFRVRWPVPAGLPPGTTRWLATYWTFWAGDVAQGIAELDVRSGR